MINYEIELDLSLSKKCIISQIYKTLEVPVNPNANPPYPLVEATAIPVATFQINNAKLYFLVVTLLINDNTKFLENIKQGFKRTISWDKYRSEITNQPKNNNLDYLIDKTFRNINRLFVLSFKNGNNDPTINSFDRYYIPLVELISNVLINYKPFFDQPVKNKQEAYEKPVEMSRNCDYTTENLLDYLYHQKYYKLIGKNLSRQTNTSVPQQINFVQKLEDDGATMFFIAEKKQKIILNFSLDSLILTE